MPRHKDEEEVIPLKDESWEIHGASSVLLDPQGPATHMPLAWASKVTLLGLAHTDLKTEETRSADTVIVLTCRKPLASQNIPSY